MHNKREYIFRGNLQQFIATVDEYHAEKWRRFSTPSGPGPRPPIFELVEPFGQQTTCNDNEVWKREFLAYGTLSQFLAALDLTLKEQYSNRPARDNIYDYYLPGEAKYELGWSDINGDTVSLALHEVPGGKVHGIVSGHIWGWDFVYRKLNKQGWFMPPNIDQIVKVKYKFFDVSLLGAEGTGYIEAILIDNGKTRLVVWTTVDQQEEMLRKAGRYSIIGVWEGLRIELERQGWLKTYMFETDQAVSEQSMKQAYSLSDTVDELSTEIFAGNTEDKKEPDNNSSLLGRSGSPALLRRLMIDYFSESDLQNLCFDLGEDYENLPGNSKQDKARELIKSLSHKGRISELIEECTKLRPHISWPNNSTFHDDVL
jgi:hypothetical protein